LTKPQGKQGKFKKDFNEQKIMRELGIIQDSQGKLVIEKKKEKFAGYEPNMNSKRFEKNKDLDDPHGIITFPQNTLKKPKTKG
jgi:hypothetical protein